MIDERSFGIVTLPSSNGNYYKNGCKKVKLYYLDGSDEEILTSMELIKSGEMIDFLLDRKVAPIDGEPFVSPKDMLVGDRIFLTVSLRASMDNFLKLVLPEAPDGVYYDLHNLRQKDVEVFPDENGEFTYLLKASKKVVKFRLMTGKDEAIVRNEYKRNGLFNTSKKAYLNQLVTEIDGEKDKILISNILQRLPLQDFRDLDRYIAEVTPGLDLNIEVEVPKLTPGGGTEIVNTFLRFDVEFWYPNTNLT